MQTLGWAILRERAISRFEADDHRFVGRDSGKQGFERDSFGLFEVEVPRFIDFAHAAAIQVTEDLVPAGNRLSIVEYRLRTGGDSARMARDRGRRGERAIEGACVTMLLKHSADLFIQTGIVTAGAMEKLVLF